MPAVTAAAKVGKTCLVVAVTAVALCACGPGGVSGEEDGGVPSSASSSSASATAPASDSSSASASAPMSPSDLPTIAKPTAPPSLPTDLVPSGVLAGRVTALTEACTEVKTDDGAVWSLVGDAQVELEVGDTVTARVVELETDAEECGTGTPARLVSIRVVGQ